MYEQEERIVANELEPSTVARHLPFNFSLFSILPAAKSNTKNKLSVPSISITTNVLELPTITGYSNHVPALISRRGITGGTEGADKELLETGYMF